MSGRFAPGDHLEPAVLSGELNASITPVRDALHRLVGERIVEAPRNDGFRVPAPTEAELRGLYGWNCELLELALRSRRGGSRGVVLRPGGATGADGVLNAPELFLRIAGRSPSAEHQLAVTNMNYRLAALRLVEDLLFEDVREELSLLSACLEAENIPALRRGIAAYHRRRQRHAPEILVGARQGSGR